MSRLLAVFILLPLLVSPLRANPLVGVWQGQILGEENQTTTLTFRANNTCRIDASMPEAEGHSLFAELFGQILYDLDLTLTNLQEHDFKIPSITQIRMEGIYLIKGKFLTVYATQLFLKIEDQHVDFGEVMADIASQLLDIIDKEATDLELVIALTVLAETGPLITSLILEEMTAGEALITSDFSIRGDRLQFQDGDFAETEFIRQDQATSVKAISWGALKGKASQ